MYGYVGVFLGFSVLVILLVVNFDRLWWVFF